MVQEVFPLWKMIVPFSDIAHTGKLTIPPQKHLKYSKKNDRFFCLFFFILKTVLQIYSLILED